MPRYVGKGKISNGKNNICIDGVVVEVECVHGCLFEWSGSFAKHHADRTRSGIKNINLGDYIKLNLKVGGWGIAFYRAKLEGVAVVTGIERHDRETVCGYIGVGPLVCKNKSEFRYLITDRTSL